MQLFLKTSSLSSTEGAGSVWEVLLNEGFSESELASNPEILAYVAMHNGIRDFRSVRPRQTIVIPQHRAMKAVVAEVRADAGFYVDAMALVSGGIGRWRALFSVEAGLRANDMLVRPTANRGSHPPQTRSVEPAVAVNNRFERPNIERPQPEGFKMKGQRLQTFVGRLFGNVGLRLLPRDNTTISWQAPTTNMNGTPLTDLAGFKVYYGNASRQYTVEVDVGNCSSFTLKNLQPGTYYFAATAYDASGNESGYTDNEPIKVIP